MATRLDSQERLDDAIRELSRADPVMARIVAAGARPRVRHRPPGFEGLAWIVTGQQVSTASAAAIWGRVRAGLGAVEAGSVQAASDEALKAFGLSTPKIRTLRALADAVASGALDLDALADLPAEAVHAALVSVKGIGPWTADVYLLFCLGHADAFPAGDLALQEAARIAYDLEARPSREALEALAVRWRPWRGAAAHALWALYARAKAREGAPAS
ncbi:DNA-3-methyladenine glycosylase family protein [Salinarimonas soli]|uniref:DNA-3-methyladenine glycosylase II n=1 Tax=Salinarimonas soli TaxID=1638099 RepID=A0A5B2V8K0_9HYPH|nr:DNA-3-methyladenine glycosylase [Salinarimonas soli]KAA2234649.1 DNA-3-methyladenine glycosylase 2 family protein [Salinarimonas soli]